MQNKKIQLFCPRQTIGFNYLDTIYWPMGILSLGSFIKKYYPQIEVELHDGEFYNDNEGLITKIDNNSNIVGVSVNTLNYGYGLEIAKKAKEKGVKNVVMGGPHATLLWRQILSNREYTDTIFLGRSEKSFLEYVKGTSLENIPNIAFRSQDKIIRTLSESSLSPDECLPYDYSLIPLQEYWKNHKEKMLPNEPNNKALEIMSHYGCEKRKIDGRCTYCSVIDPTYWREPKLVWEEIIESSEKWGFNFVKDFGDSITGNPSWLEQLVQEKPSKINFPFFVYARADETIQTIDLLKTLNVKYVFIGFESGNQKMLDAMNKRTTVEQGYQAAKLLGERNIGLFSSYVLGFEEETQETIKDTLDFAKRVTRLATTYVSSASPLSILPGSTCYNKLLKKYPEYIEKDLLDVSEMRERWVKTFCHGIDYKLLEDFSTEIGKLSPLKNAWGWKPTEF